MLRDNKSPPHARLVWQSIEEEFAEDKLSEYFSIIKADVANVPAELENELEKWNSQNAVLIASGPGTGKSTAVRTLFYPDALKKGKRILVVANRRALIEQYKHQFLEMVDSPALRELTEEGIKNRQEFDGLPVTFCLYQSLPKLMKKLRNETDPIHVNPFAYAVFDECHFFSSDALFADGTWYLLKSIVRTFSDSIRVYMTATPWAVYNPIAEAESNRESLKYRCLLSTIRYPIPPPPCVKFYDFPNAERNMTLHVLPAEFRNKTSEGILKLISTIPTNEKLIVFTDSKQRGKNAAAKLKERSITVSYLDAEQKAGPVWESLTKKSFFDARVLLCTSVADCGLNIIDDCVRHIVLLTTDHVEFIQELGRKRAAEGEPYHVYVPQLTKDQLSHFKGRYQQLCDQLDTFNACPPEDQYKLRFQEWYSGSSDVRHLIPIDGRGRLYVNRAAEYAVRQNLLLYKRIEKLEISGDEYAFITIVREWLHEPSVDWSMAKTDQEDGRNELIKYLQSFVGKPLPNGEPFESFAKGLKSLREKYLGTRDSDNASRDKWGSIIIKRELESLTLPFSLVKQGNDYFINEKNNNQEVT